MLYHPAPRPGSASARRARRTLLGAGFLSASLQSSLALADTEAPVRELVCDYMLENFSASKVGQFPVGWRTRDADQMPLVQQKQIYVVAKEGKRKVLHARYRDTAITIGKSVKGWNLDDYPVLQWQWKAVKLPTGGNEDRHGKNDCAASIYSFWDIGFPFQVDSVKYTWSSTLKVGTQLRKRLGHDYVRVLESGTRALSQWRTMRVNLKEDHRRLFGKQQTRHPSGIALLTDADATNSEAEAYYADFRLCRYRS